MFLGGKRKKKQPRGFDPPGEVQYLYAAPGKGGWGWGGWGGPILMLRIHDPIFMEIDSGLKV